MASTKVRKSACNAPRAQNVGRRDHMNFATSTCTVLDASTSQCVYMEGTSTPLMVQDAGNISFGLAIIIVLLATMFVAFLFNSFGGSRR